jgi:hypothetical protein
VRIRSWASNSPPCPFAFKSRTIIRAKHGHAAGKLSFQLRGGSCRQECQPDGT